jgi:hypothetical protein
MIYAMLLGKTVILAVWEAFSGGSYVKQPLKPDRSLLESAGFGLDLSGAKIQEKQ